MGLPNEASRATVSHGRDVLCRQMDPANPPLSPPRSGPEKSRTVPPGTRPPPPPPLVGLPHGAGVGIALASANEHPLLAGPPTNGSIQAHSQWQRLRAWQWWQDEWTNLFIFSFINLRLLMPPLSFFSRRRQSKFILIQVWSKQGTCTSASYLRILQAPSSQTSIKYWVHVRPHFFGNKERGRRKIPRPPSPTLPFAAGQRCVLRGRGDETSKRACHPISSPHTSLHTQASEHLGQAAFPRRAAGTVTLPTWFGT